MVDAKTGERKSTLKDSSKHPLFGGFTTDSKLLATYAKDGSVRIWDAKTGESTHILKDLARDCSLLGFDQTGKLLTMKTSHRSTTFRWWDAASGECLTTRKVGEDDADFSWRSLNRDCTLMAALVGERHIQVWDIEKEQKLTTLLLKQGEGESVDPKGVIEWSPDARALAFPGSDQKVHVIEVATGRELCSIDTGQDSISCIAFSPVSDMLVTSGSETVIWGIPDK